MSQGGGAPSPILCLSGDNEQDVGKSQLSAGGWRLKQVLLRGGWDEKATNFINNSQRQFQIDFQYDEERSLPSFDTYSDFLALIDSGVLTPSLILCKPHMHKESGLWQVVN